MAVKFNASMKVEEYDKNNRCKKDFWQEILKPAFKTTLFWSCIIVCKIVGFSIFCMLSFQISYKDIPLKLNDV